MENHHVQWLNPRTKSPFSSSLFWHNRRVTLSNNYMVYGRSVNARFIKRFSDRHSVCLCIFYHVYEGFVVLVLGGASTPFFHGSQALSFSIWNAWPGWIPIWFFRSLRYSAKVVTRGINPGFSKRRLAANCCTWALRGLILPSILVRRIWPFTRLISDSVELSPPTIKKDCFLFKAAGIFKTFEAFVKVFCCCLVMSLCFSSTVGDISSMQWRAGALGSPNLRQVAVRACSAGFFFDCCCFNTKILGWKRQEWCHQNERHNRKKERKIDR